MQNVEVSYVAHLSANCDNLCVQDPGVKALMLGGNI